MLMTFTHFYCNCIFWEQKELGQLGKVAMNKRVFKDQTSETGEVPFFKIGTFGKEPDSFITKELFEEYKNKYPFPNVGDILISASGSIGRLVVYQGKNEYFQDSNIVWLDHNGKIDNLFLKQFYSIVNWKGLEGTTIKRLYNKDILKTKIVLPNLVEQKQVGKFFDLLEKLITLYQRKKDCLDQLYKGLLEYLTENYDEMSTFRIGELFEERDERTSNRELLSVTISSGVVPFNTINKTDNSSDDKSRYKCVEKNDIVYNSMRMWQGASGLSNYTGIVSPAYTVLKPRENVNPAYISKVFKKRTIINFFTRFSQGLTSDTWNLKYNQIKDINISLPSNNAQKEIISVLSSIEKIKKEVNNKGNTFNKLKKSYLDKLFL